MLDERTPTEELPLPLLPGLGLPGDPTLHVPPGEPGISDSLRRLRALEEAILEHERATGHPAVPRRPGDHELYRRLRSGQHGGRSNGSG